MPHEVILDAAPSKPLTIPKFRPNGDRVVIQPDTVEDRTRGGIILPPSVQATRQKEVATGRIVGVGEGMLCIDGSRWPMPKTDDGKSIEVGQRVMYYRHGVVDLPLPEGDYVSVRDEFVLAVLEDGGA
jgi:co-chaperonin GroES (HSP10)